ncbi:MAG: DNA double-strand break repair nuclease NurA [Promethearchaeota archaeon]
MKNKKDTTVLKECIEFIQKHKKILTEGDTPYITGEKEISYDITEERIFKIPQCADKRKLGFVDGGTASILTAADFNISLNRIAGVLFENNKVKQLKETPEIIEFYAATIYEPQSDGKIAYCIQLFPRETKFAQYLPNDEIIIPIDEVRELMGYRFMPNIEMFGSVAMRFAEWSYGTKFIENELHNGDIFIRDGSLQTGFKGEILLVRDLYSKALEKDVYVSGLSKSCRLITKNGDSLISLIDLIASNKYANQKWYYHPIYKMTKADNLADVYFTKLHQHARSPFRFDIYIEQSEKLDQQEKEIIIANIALNSNDLSFPGYPYGLIKVDQLSRVGVREIEPQKIQLISEFDSDIYKKFILPRIRSIDAHDLLNSIRKN